MFRSHLPPRLASLLVALFFAAVGGEPTRANEQANIYRSEDELVVHVPQLDVWRQKHRRLDGRLSISGTQQNQHIKIDFASPAVSSAVIVDLTRFGECRTAELDVTDESGKTISKTRVSPVPTIPLRPAPFASSVGPRNSSNANRWSAIERGSQLPADDSPAIALPDVSQVRSLALPSATRRFRTSEITYPVIADTNPPGIGSTNYVILGRQTAAPDDPQRRSLYLSYRQPLFDRATSQLKEWRKSLVEVPLDPYWLVGSTDQEIDIPRERFFVHTTDEREKFGKRWNSATGYHMLGSAQTGLFQGGQTADVDDQGRLYITNIPDGAGIVRFHPHLARFEQPPVNCFDEFRQFLPTAGEWRRNWDTDLAQVVCRGNRVFLVFDRNYRVRTPNGAFETCSGVISIPQDHWDDAEAFRKDIRLHAACWPTAEFPLYRNEPDVGMPRRLGAPLATKHGIVFGSFRIDLDAQGRTSRLAEIAAIEDKTDKAGEPLPKTEIELLEGLRKQRWLNVGAAGRALVQQAYGELRLTRAALALMLPGHSTGPLVEADGRPRVTFPNAPTGELTLRFDLVDKIASEPQRYGELATGLSGPSTGPTYAALAIPDEPGRMLAVCEYTYFLSVLDFLQRHEEKRVRKTYVTTAHQADGSGFPLAARLGPYNSTWIHHDNAQWLYLVGYTGMSRLKYAEQGQPTTARRVDVFHQRLSAQSLDGARRDSVKDFLHLIPTTDDRWINIGRGRVGRGGGARSAGLELFTPQQIGASQTAVEMNRCFGLQTPVGRMVYSASNAPATHELFVASGLIRPEYVQDIDDPSKRPANHDPKIFTYACSAGGPLRDLFGFSLPPKLEGGVAPGQLAMSPCRRFLVILQQNGMLWSYHIRGRQFVDAVRLVAPNGQPITPLEFTRPSASLWTSPSDQIFFHTLLDQSSPQRADFYEVQVALAGQLKVQAHAAIDSGRSGKPREFEDIVHCFLPDLVNRDGSYDLVLGGEQDQGGSPSVRVLDDFIPPK